MSISDQFSGLDMEQLISAPLKATAEAQKQLAESTEEFISQVGFDRNGEVRTVKSVSKRSCVNSEEIT